MTAINEAISSDLDIDSFEKRLSVLFDNKRKIIVYVKQVFDNSTFRYRAYNVRQALSGSDKYAVTFFLDEEIDRVLRYLDRASAIIFQRAFWSVNVNNLLKFCEFNGIPKVFDIDDYIYKPECVPEILLSMNYDYKDNSLFHALLTQSSLHYMVAKKCDYFITSNEVLADCIKNEFSKPVLIIKNFLNEEQERVSEKAINKKKTHGGVFEIGYFSGTPTHYNDFALIADEIANLMKENEDVRLKIVGYMGVPAILAKDYGNRIERVPFMPYVELQQEIASVDLNIVPLYNSRFTDCKSELKFFEAGIVKTLTVASPAYAYKECIEDGKNGFLCSLGGWSQTIQKVIDMDNEKSRSIVEQAYRISKKAYSLESQMRPIEDVFDNLCIG